MDINQQALDQLFIDMNGGLQAGMENGPNMAFFDKVVTQFKSTTTKTLYPFLRRTQQFKEWLGARRFEDVISNKFVVKNRKFEDSVRMFEDDLDDDIHGVYVPIATQMGEAWTQLKLRLPTEVIVDNFVSFDGLPIIDDGHKYGRYDIDNKVTTPLSSAAIEAADGAAGEWKHENGEPTMTTWTQLVVGPTLAKRAWDIFENLLANDGTGGGDSIAWQNYFSSAERKSAIVINPYLTKNAGAGKDVDATFFWYLVDTSRSIGPIGFQTRRDIRTIMDTDPSRVMRTGNVDFMGDGRVAALPTFPHLIYGSFATS